MPDMLYQPEEKDVCRFPKRTDSEEVRSNVERSAATVSDVVRMRLQTLARDRSFVQVYVRVRRNFCACYSVMLQSC